MTDEILIIDKDVSHAEALCVYLERKRMENHMASTPDEAVMLFDNIGARIVLADPDLPDMEVTAFLKSIKSTHPQVQIIVMTTPEQFDETMAELKTDAVHYLLKPVKSTA
ncbi:MAG: response regulator, partial [Desulfobacterales bacterium]